MAVMSCCPDQRIIARLARKRVIVTGTREYGKPTLPRQPMDRLMPADHLDRDGSVHRVITTRQDWNPLDRLLVPAPEPHCRLGEG
jgi:hypothetical protein